MFELDTGYLSDGWRFYDQSPMAGDSDWMSGGFNFGPLSTAQYTVGPVPDGLVNSGTRSSNEWSWFDQSKISAGFSDVLNAGLSGLKGALANEISGNSKKQGTSFWDVLKMSSLDRFTSSQTGRQLRSDVLASQFRTAMQSPMTWVMLAVAIVGGIYLLRR